MTPAVRTLLIANVVVYFLEKTMAGIIDVFVFVPQLVLSRPWTVVTYMFLHDPNGISHILFNMLALFFFGPRVEERIGTRRFTNLYFISGIAGAILSFFLAPRDPILGASGAVFGVTLAFAWYWPDAPIYIWGVLPVPAKFLVVGYGVLSLFQGFVPRFGGGVAHFAHLGGYVGAFLYLKWLQRSSTAFRRRATTPVIAPDRSVAKYQSIDRSRIHEINREEVDRILDKISATGLGSLTPQERAFLSNFVPPDDRVPPVQ